MPRPSSVILATLALQTIFAQQSKPAPTHVPLATYTDPAHGVSFQYPSVWTRPNWKESQPPFDYCSPAVFGTDRNAVPIHMAVQFSGDHNVYAHSQLSSLVFLYGIKRKISSDECRGIADISEAEKPNSVAIHGVTFTHADGGDCGLGHSVDAKVYTTFRRNACYVFEEDFYTGNFEGARDLTQSEMRALQRHLDTIMQSVRFDQH